MFTMSPSVTPGAELWPEVQCKCLKASAPLGGAAVRLRSVCPVVFVPGDRTLQERPPDLAVPVQPPCVASFGIERLTPVFSIGMEPSPSVSQSLAKASSIDGASSGESGLKATMAVRRIKSCCQQLEKPCYARLRLYVT